MMVVTLVRTRLTLMPATQITFKHDADPRQLRQRTQQWIDGVSRTHVLHRIYGELSQRRHQLHDVGLLGMPFAA